MPTQPSAVLMKKKSINRNNMHTPLIGPGGGGYIGIGSDAGGMLGFIEGNKTDRSNLS
jgi:hypothetical protein